MQTVLDEPTLSRVVSIVDEVGQAIESGTDQDHLLMLTCLQLAYTLEKVSKKLESLEEKLQNISAWVPSSESSVSESSAFPTLESSPKNPISTTQEDPEGARPGPVI